jgi:hypothetical protein
MTVSVDQVPGNADVVAALERMLFRARAGQFSYLAMVAYQHPNKAVFFIGGAVPSLGPTRKLVDRLTAVMDESIINHTMPDRNIDLGADHVCYNVASWPCSFDFLPWLVDAEMTRVREGAPAPLKVAFWMGRDGKTGLDTPARKQMLERVMRPMLGLIGAVEDQAALDGRFKSLVALCDVVDAARAGEQVPILQASAAAIEQVSEAIGDKPPVTITLRETHDWPHRNSNLDTWMRVARYLEGRGEKVVFVRDTAKAQESLPGFQTCPLASLDIDTRVALYESAKANLFVSNGPVTLAFFLKTPWLMFFKPEPDDHAYPHNTLKSWRDGMHLELGQQFPWALPNQRLVWDGDDYETIVTTWEQCFGSSSGALTHSATRPNPTLMSDPRCPRKDKAAPGVTVPAAL